jgi:hypothetical protein
LAPSAEWKADAVPLRVQYSDTTGSGWSANGSFAEQYLDNCGIFKDAALSILAVVAKQERVRRFERTKASIERRRAEGKRVGPETRIDHSRVRAL